MWKLMTLMFVLLGVHVGSALGQTPSEMLIGTWVSESAFCGKSIYKVERVDQKGVVFGSFSCLSTNWNPAMGDKVGRNDVKGTLVGNRFVMVNDQGGGNDLMVSATKLEGTGRARAGSPQNPSVFLKQ